MSFLAPWFVLAGVAAVSLPVLFHLFRRTPRGRMPFSTLMFLAPSPPRLTRRSRLENWPLLLLRAAVLVLLALAFGRPFLRQFLEQQDERPVGARTVMLVDCSASMRRGELWTAAIRETERIIDRTGPYDELALVAFAGAPRTLVSFDAWLAAPTGERAGLARAAFAGLAPTWSATRLDEALIAAAEMLDAADRNKEATNADRAKRIVLVSDMQAGSHLNGLQGFEWPRRVQVEWVSLPNETTNAGLHPLAAHDEAATANAALQRPRVIVTNAANSTRESFELAWQSVSQPAQAETATNHSLPVYVPPGQTRVVRAPPLPAGEVMQLALRGDDEPFDNALWFVPPAREQVRVLLLGSEKADDPQSLRYFLERALGQSVTGRTITVEAVDPQAAGVRVPRQRDLADVPLVVVTGEQVLPADWYDALKGWLEQGGIALAVIERANDQAWRGLLPDELAGPERIEVVESDKSREYALLGEIDLRHPLFKPLADPRFSDFSKIRFWRWRRLQLDDVASKQSRVLARFDSGAPALVETQRGAGRMILLASGWQPRESQLGVSSKFVPLMNTLVELGWRRAPPAVSYDSGTVIDLANLGNILPSPLVGEGSSRSEPGEGSNKVPTPIPSAPPLLPQGARGVTTAGPWTIITPSGKTLSIAVDAPRFEPEEGPGVYEVRSAAGVQRIAVNLPADESKTAPLEPAALEALGVRLASEETAATPQTLAEKQTLQSRELEARQQLWRWCLVLALGATVVETWYAGRVARRENVA